MPYVECLGAKGESMAVGIPTACIRREKSHHAWHMAQFLMPTSNFLVPLGIQVSSEKVIGDTVM